jgi:hypothetical protein
MKMKDCCWECGKDRYKPVKEKHGITIYEGICPFCKKKKMLVPALDWAGCGG